VSIELVIRHVDSYEEAEFSNAREYAATNVLRFKVQRNDTRRMLLAACDAVPLAE